MVSGRVCSAQMWWQETSGNYSLLTAVSQQCLRCDVSLFVLHSQWHCTGQPWLQKSVLLNFKLFVMSLGFASRRHFFLSAQCKLSTNSWGLAILTVFFFIDGRKCNVFVLSWRNHFRLFVAGKFCAVHTSVQQTESLEGNILTFLHETLWSNVALHEK